MKRFINAANILQTESAVGVIPTDTVYGLAARASDEKAVSRMYKLKDRAGIPGTIIAANIDQLVALGVKRRYLKAVEDYWPGPLSVIVPCVDKELEYLHQGKMSLAIRIPAELRILWLLETVGPLVTTSANHHGKQPANTVEEAKAYFNDDVDFYVDGGNLSGRSPSTIIRIVDDAIEILREGAVKIDETGRKGE